MEKYYNHNQKYLKLNWWKSIYSVVPHLILLYICMNVESLLVAPIYAMLLVRTFILMHDAGHGILFPSKILNDIFGYMFATINFTSYSSWIETHTEHHENSNKVDEIQHLQSAPLTVKQFRELSVFKRFIYRIIYGKYTLFTIMPSFYFFIYQRFMSTLFENCLFVSYIYFMTIYFSYSQIYYVVCSYTLGGIIGFIIFHLQHTFDDVYREESTEWKREKNALYGSSFLQIPFFLKWFMHGNEYHHIHHLNAKIPAYNLQKCHEESGELYNCVKKVWFSDIFSTYYYSLRYRDKFVDTYDY